MCVFEQAFGKLNQTTQFTSSCTSDRLLIKRPGNQLLAFWGSNRSNPRHASTKTWVGSSHGRCLTTRDSMQEVPRPAAHSPRRWPLAEWREMSPATRGMVQPMNITPSHLKSPKEAKQSKTRSHIKKTNNMSHPLVPSFKRSMLSNMQGICMRPGVGNHTQEAKQAKRPAFLGHLKSVRESSNTKPWLKGVFWGNLHKGWVPVQGRTSFRVLWNLDMASAVVLGFQVRCQRVPGQLPWTTGPQGPHQHMSRAG